MQGRKKQSFSDNVRWGDEWDSFPRKKYNLAKVTHFGNASLREGKPAVNIHSRLCNINPGPHLCTTLEKKKDSLCDFMCQKAPQCVIPDDCQIPTAVWALFSSVGPAQLPWNDVETAGRLLVRHPVFWAVRGGWRRTQAATSVPTSHANTIRFISIS